MNSKYFILILFALFLFPKVRADIYDFEKFPHQSIIRHASFQHHVPEALIRALIKVESNFNESAVSQVGAQGLMQIMPQTALELGVDNPFDPRQNILAGTRYFQDLLNQFEGNLEKALAAYNAGPETVEKFQGVPPFKETKKFIKLVLHYYKKYSHF